MHAYINFSDIQIHFFVPPHMNAHIVSYVLYIISNFFPYQGSPLVIKTLSVPVLSMNGEDRYLKLDLTCPPVLVSDHDT
jgi:hypothetical protein